MLIVVCLMSASLEMYYWEKFVWKLLFVFRNAGLSLTNIFGTQGCFFQDYEAVQPEGLICSRLGAVLGI